ARAAAPRVAGLSTDKAACGRAARSGAGAKANELKLRELMRFCASVADIDARWKANEAQKRINSRIFDGPANISANVRIVLPGDEPQTHEGTADLWLVTAGEAVAETDGQIAEVNGAKTIRNGMAAPVHPG